MQVSAIAKNIRISPEKIRPMVAKIKNLPPTEAISHLDFINKSAAPILKKVIMSALANAQNNSGLAKDLLTFKAIIVNIGPTAKRFRPQSRGRVHQILKRTSHIEVILEGEKSKEVSKVSQVSEVSKAQPEANDQK